MSLLGDTFGRMLFGLAASYCASCPKFPIIILKPSTPTAPPFGMGAASEYLSRCDDFRSSRGPPRIIGSIHSQALKHLCTPQQLPQPQATNIPLGLSSSDSDSYDVLPKSMSGAWIFGRHVLGQVHNRICVC